MEQKIVIVIAGEHYKFYGGTFYECTYTIKDSFTDRKSLCIFHNDTCIYGNNAKTIEIKEFVNNVDEETKIEITLNK